MNEHGGVKIKTAKRKKAIISVLLVCVMAVMSVFVVGAVNASNSGTKTSGTSFISWTFYSSGSGNTMNDCCYTKLTPSTGAVVTDKSRIGYDTSEAYGYVTATKYGSAWLDTFLAWHKIHNNAITVHVA